MKSKQIICHRIIYSLALGGLALLGYRKLVGLPIKLAPLNPGAIVFGRVWIEDVTIIEVFIDSVLRICVLILLIIAYDLPEWIRQEKIRRQKPKFDPEKEEARFIKWVEEDMDRRRREKVEKDRMERAKDKKRKAIESYDDDNAFKRSRYQNEETEVNLNFEKVPKADHIKVVSNHLEESEPASRILSKATESRSEVIESNESVHQQQVGIEETMTELEVIGNEEKVKVVGGIELKESPSEESQDPSPPRMLLTATETTKQINDRSNFAEAIFDFGVKVYKEWLF